MSFRVLKSLYRRLRHSTDGVAAIEFAFCAPILLLLLLGSMEISLMLMSDRKVTSSSSSMVDLAARFEEMEQADLDNIFTAGKIILGASSTNEAKSRLTSVRLENGNPVVDWSVRCGQFAKLYPGDEVADIPAGLIAGSETILKIETEYEFDSLFEFVVQGKRTLSDTFYHRPRTAQRIKLNFPAMSYSCPW